MSSYTNATEMLRDAYELVLADAKQGLEQAESRLNPDNLDNLEPGTDKVRHEWYWKNRAEAARITAQLAEVRITEINNRMRGEG